MILTDEKKTSNANKDIGVCVKSKDWTVQWQNAKCLNTCGNRTGQICSDNCNLWSRQSHSENEDGAHVFKNQNMNQEPLDVVVCQSETEIVSLLCPIQNRIEEREAQLRLAGLTPREIEIMLLKDKGYKQSRICAELFISLSTLKTHISHIRQKMRITG